MSDSQVAVGKPPAVESDDAHRVPRQGAAAITPSSRAEAISHTDLHLVNLLLAALAAACVIAALAGSIVHQV